MIQTARPDFVADSKAASEPNARPNARPDSRSDSQADKRPDRYQQALAALRPGLLAAAGVSAVISVLMLTGSVYMLQVYDRVLASGSVPTLLGLFAIVVILYAFLGFYDFLRARMLSRLALRLDGILGPQAFQSALSGQGTGPAKAQPLREIDALRGFLSGPAMPGLFDLPWVPLYLGVLFMVHPWLGWLTIAGSAIVAGLAWLGHHLSQGLLTRSLTDDAVARDFAERSQRSADMITAMGMQASVSTRWRSLHDAGLAAGQRAGNPGEMIGATSRAFRMLMQSAILTLGAYLVIQGEMSGGMIIASSILTGRALGPVDQVIGQWRAIGKALESHRRLQAFFGHEPQKRCVMALPEPSGQISVKGLVKLLPLRAGEHATGIAAAIDRPRLLDGISFDLAPGDAMGVVGASGSGKSTLARLLAGATGADGGEIRLDGATRDQWEPATLGRRIGYLPQQVDLLPGTLRDNIARFDATLTDDDVMAAANLTGVHEMILRLPDGYGTRIGGLGEALPLSGGQVQRVGLARALCGRPALVILDEPNSNLDSAGEACLTRAIIALKAAGAVVIVMAHRPNVLVVTNKLLLLEAGRMVEFGDRDVLLARGPQTAVAPIAGPITGPIAGQASDPITGPTSGPTSGPTFDPTSVPVTRPIQLQPAAAATPMPVPVAGSAPESPNRARAPGASPDMMRRVRVFGANPRTTGLSRVQ